MAATRCDGCGQALHAPPNVAQLRHECSVRERHIIFALLSIAGMVALNIAFFRGAAYVLGTAPFAWLIWICVRFRALRQMLARIETRG